MDDPTEITRRPGALRAMLGEAWGADEVDRSWERLEYTVTRARRLRLLRLVVTVLALALLGFALGRALRARRIALDRAAATSGRR